METKLGTVEQRGESAGTPHAAALYISALTKELAELARGNGLKCLGYILDMARLEADQSARRSIETDQEI